MELSEKLKNARISRKITQKTLAESLGVSRTTLSLWENGKAVPTILHLREYQRIFDFEKGYFETKKKGTPVADSIVFDISTLNPLGRRELERFYKSLLKKKEYLKKNLTR